MGAEYAFIAVSLGMIACVALIGAAGLIVANRLDNKYPDAKP